MNFFKRLNVLFLAFVLGVCSLTTTAFASDTNTPNSVKAAVYDSNVDAIMPLSSDQTFIMSSYHRGADQRYYKKYVDYSVTVTDTNGNAVDNTIIVTLQDYDGNVLSTGTVYANGHTVGPSNIPITPGKLYYFTYSLASGVSRNLRVRIVVDNHN